MFKKILLRLIAFAIFGAIVVFVFGGFLASCSKPQEPPTITEAPWVVQTSSRLYYAKELKMLNGEPYIRGYWTYDGKRFHFEKGSLSFSVNSYGQVKVIRREVKWEAS